MSDTGDGGHLFGDGWYHHPFGVVVSLCGVYRCQIIMLYA